MSIRLRTILNEWILCHRCVRSNPVGPMRRPGGRQRAAYSYGRGFGFSDSYVPQMGEPSFISIFTSSAVQLRLSLCLQSVAPQKATWAGWVAVLRLGWAMVCSRGNHVRIVGLPMIPQSL